MKIVATFNNPPIPDRRWDWSAIDADTYDADCDQDGFFSTHPIGLGRTAREAINDLLSQMDPVDVYVAMAFDEIPAVPS
ncbi:MAG: hypothetical protein IT548_06975 [Alphaproteobacteria bacterium]|nr:hypothetical protein [Alphaproteobacteria bacterium]